MAAKRLKRPSPISLLLASLVLIGCLIAAHRSLSLILLIILFLAGIFAMRLDVAKLAAGIGKFWFFILLTFLIHAALSGGNTGGSGFSLTFGFSGAGFAAAGWFTLRLIVLLLTGIALGRAHSPQTYALVLGQIMGKLRFWRSSLAQLELTVSLSLQFVPFLEEEYRRLTMAFEARGITPNSGLFSKLLIRRRILLPLMVSALRRAEHTSQALHARGFNPARIRTQLHPIRTSALEIMLLFAFSAVCVGSLWL